MIPLQYAKANLPAYGKGDDTVFLHPLGEQALLLGVADGVSNASGGAAARWISTTMADLCTASGAETWTARELFARLLQRLEDHAAQSPTGNQSLSTLSCGIARPNSSDFLRFDFFGIGDSPIWRIFRPTPSLLRFQASVAFGAPVPSECAAVYNFVDLAHGRVEGPVHFGSVDIQHGELLVVATDGVPETQVLFDDQDLPGSSPQLLESLLAAPEINDEMLIRLLLGYNDRSLLIDDDASLAVVRFGQPAEAIRFVPKIASLPDGTAVTAAPSETLGCVGAEVDALPDAQQQGNPARERKKRKHRKKLTRSQRKALKRRTRPES